MDPEHGDQGEDEEPGGAETSLNQRWANEFDNPDGKDIGWRIDQSCEWREQGAAGLDEFFGIYTPAKKFNGFKAGYVFKLDHLGLGYYRDQPGRIAICLEEASQRGKISPLVLVLNDVIQEKPSVVGDLLAATTLDDKTNGTPTSPEHGKRRPKKAKKKRKMVEGPMMKPIKDTEGNHEALGVQWIDQLSISACDKSHREVGLWAFETFNPNAMNGGHGAPGDYGSGLCHDPRDKSRARICC